MKQFLISACTTFFLFFTAAAQNIDSTIEIYAAKYGQERAYIHYDKSTYAPGETIWFKVYMLQDIYPANGSKTFYIDWTDDKGNLLSHNSSPVVDGTTVGQFDIPATYTGKFIHIKAYTKWMLNFDSAFLYNNDLRILTTNTLTEKTKIVITPALQFFPEGGDIVAGVTNKVAFKANDQYGRPVKIKGIVQNKSGGLLDSLHIIHDGMGFFLLHPDEGESFSAKWKDEKGTEHISPLPEIKPGGVAISILISGKNRILNVTATPEVAASLGSIHVIGTMYQHQVFQIAKEFKDGAVNGVVPTQGLPSGVLTITTFDNQWKPIAERITYINNGEFLFHPEMEVQHWGLNKRARNEIQIAVPDSLDADFSVSVTDIDIDADSSDNIISHLMLTGELKGKVYNPSYYFTNDSDTLSQQLDLVMLTHGWRRFNWDKVIKGEFPEISYPKDTAYLTLSGKVYGALPSQLREADNIILLINNKMIGKKMVVIPVESNGTFNDPSFLLFDTAQIYYQLSKAKGLGDVSVKFLEGRLPPLRYNIAATGNFYSKFFDTTGNARHLQLASQLADIANRYKAKVLETVTIKVKTKSPVQMLDEKYTSGLFRGGDGYQFDLLDDTRAAGSRSIFDYLQGQVAGLQVNSSSSPPSLQWRGGAPQLYLDEVSTDASFISSIPISDVAYIKVLRPPFMGSSNGGSGAIAIYTRRGDDRKSAPGKGLSSNTVTGYTPIREFYSPNYGTISPDDDKADIRTTVYWNPQVVTTPVNNKVVLTFYNNDISRAFRVTIEGMTKDGRLAHLEQIME
ncbi:MAG: hypothetical protein M3015_00480 [Bacteroidota bacterium]|nr:hypothetical protein [Bacteroidota bacterium]